ncbi:hypothetical protein A2223_02940 [Candidatus Falkowbacteria bacterium RIFOXYA2_FULL_35_8]|uniref:Uncharacterized protein n=1 Tax=Candidatus Falkowbacteria bacterium RIFOXYC2_FULL_36_12 TaxID=1798002 RepID=A0A1F5SZ43_9BACT|nr:MAG: hypothetical protein A2300_03400 [Candidatus Falkowbacteria bacterium RIFOXYB2_FULL_35_7]OGF31912.1 MAG: hypothetical protein A2478_05540 [Candidatus Falkowbacteria bacterium RIFOXYC2_FULL_36_12]OGF34674.1 MAG: hypothetical protein A2223_02940 [Candidatus Falkowbacteria bacterium RIFOXYA2_FULL_35_8]
MVLAEQFNEANQLRSRKEEKKETFLSNLQAREAMINQTINHELVSNHLPFTTEKRDDQFDLMRLEFSFCQHRLLEDKASYIKRPEQDDDVIKISFEIDSGEKLRMIQVTSNEDLLGKSLARRLNMSENKSQIQKILKSNPNELAGFIANLFRDDFITKQMIKAFEVETIDQARTYLTNSIFDLGKRKLISNLLLATINSMLEKATQNYIQKNKNSLSVPELESELDQIIDEFSELEITKTEVAEIQVNVLKYLIDGKTPEQRQKNLPEFKHRERKKYLDHLRRQMIKAV